LGPEAAAGDAAAAAAPSLPARGRFLPLRSADAAAAAAAAAPAAAAADGGEGRSAPPLAARCCWRFGAVEGALASAAEGGGGGGGARCLEAEAGAGRDADRERARGAGGVGLASFAFFGVSRAALPEGGREPLVGRRWLADAGLLRAGDAATAAAASATTTVAASAALADGLRERGSRPGDGDKAAAAAAAAAGGPTAPPPFAGLLRPALLRPEAAASGFRPSDGGDATMATPRPSSFFLGDIPRERARRVDSLNGRQRWGNSTPTRNGSNEQCDDGSRWTYATS